MARYRETGRSPIDIDLACAADMERWAEAEERNARFLRGPDREEALRWAEAWRKKAKALLDRAIRDEAEFERDPVGVFEPRTPIAEQIGHALPRYLADKGSAVGTRHRAKRRR